MKKLIIVLVLAAVGSSYAAPMFDRETRMRHKAEAQARKDKRTGGKIIKPGSAAGAFAFVNARKYTGDEYVDLMLKQLRKNFRIDLKEFAAQDVTAKNAAEVIRANGATAGLIFVENADCPLTVCVAPEEGWAIVNMTALGKDGADAQRLKARAMKEFVRGFAMVAGSTTGSRFEGGKSVMGKVRSLADLDAMQNNALPFDVQQDVDNKISLVGIRSFIETTYIEACQQGWAPAPTNENQKAIWDQVHALPSKPLQLTK